MSREVDAWRSLAARRYAEGVAEGRRLEREDTLAWLRRLACVSRSMATAFPPGALRAAYQILGTAYEAGALYVASGRHVGASEGGAAGSDSEAGGAPTGSPESRGGVAEGGDAVEPSTGRGGGL